MNRAFLLSPAHSGGRRAGLLLRPQANFELARRVQIGDATLGEIFAFCSGLYFRGKLTYARRFAATEGEPPAIHVITPNRGLLDPNTPVAASELLAFGTVSVDANEPRFTDPLRRDAEVLAATGKDVVLLGSIATGKYVDCLLPILGERLLFPSEFVGRGDMSRGGLLLRCADSGVELSYTPVIGSVRKGRRAAKIPPRTLHKGAE